LNFLREYFKEGVELEGRKELTQKAKEFEQLEEEMKPFFHKLNFKNVHYEQSIECLKNLKKLDLSLFNNLDITIIDRGFRISPVGKISIPWDFEVSDLFNFLNFIGTEKISKIKTYNETMKNILNESKFFRIKFSENIGS
jgi:hypothetical protein